MLAERHPEVPAALLRAKINNNRAFHRNGAEADGAGRYLSNGEEIGT
jgi:hypothetical protein